MRLTFWIVVSCTVLGLSTAAEAKKKTASKKKPAAAAKATAEKAVPPAEAKAAPAAAVAPPPPAPDPAPVVAVAPPAAPAPQPTPAATTPSIPGMPGMKFSEIKQASSSSSSSSETRSGSNIDGMTKSESQLRAEAAKPVSDDVAPEDPDNAMPDKYFNKLLKKIKDTGSQDQQLRIMEAQSKGHRFTSAQLARIIQIIDFEDDRMKTFRIFVPLLTDRENVDQAVSKIEYDDEQSRARKLIEKL